MDTQSRNLVQLGRGLQQRGYRFTTITPESHARVNGRRRNSVARSLRDVFGWSRPFEASLVPRDLLTLLQVAEVVRERPDRLLECSVRFSTAGDAIFLHSAFPTAESDSVFFGPDTYRYLQLLRRLNPTARRVVDVGCGTGAGGIIVAPRCERVVLTDINARALRYAAVNVELNGVTNAELIESDVLHGVDGPIDLVISNPPYLVDDASRLYRDGGGSFGEGLSVEIVRQSLERLDAGGRLILYTASAIVDGVDTLREAIRPLISSLSATYDEIDPDVFGEELDRNSYERVDRIAVVALDVRIP